MAAQPAVAAKTPEYEINAAENLYFNGRSSEARRALVGLLEAPAARDPGNRLAVLRALLDVCIHSYAQDCLLEYAPKYVEAAAGSPVQDEAQRLHLALAAQFYLDEARQAVGSPEVYRAILASPGWKHERIDDLALYMRRQLLLADVQMAVDDYAAADQTLSKLLSAVATLENPQAAAFDVAYVLSGAIASLLNIGQTERAYGLYLASRAFITAALPTRSVDAVAFRLTEAQVLEEIGNLAGAQAALDDALGKLAKVELDDEVRAGLAGRALTLKSVICAARGDIACARAAIQGHPLEARFKAGQAPATFDEVAYLAARGLAAARAGESDPIVAKALAAPVSLESPSLTDVAETYRVAGLALALPPGQARRAALLEVGPRVNAMAARQPKGGFGAWYRPGVVDQTLIALALGQGGPQPSRSDAEVAFTLFQLAGRTGAAFDSDALTALGQARDPMQRRTVHQALRLKARRDRLERAGVGRMAGRALSARAVGGAGLVHDAVARRTLRDFNLQIAEAGAALSRAGIATSGANLVELDRFQASLHDGEVALAVAPLAGDVMAYMCVRRDAAMHSVLKADLRQAQLDAKLIQAGLTAGHAPSDALDAQFPVAAAVRLYDVLIRPFGDCIRPGDHIIWLPKLAAFSTPLAVLLEAPPPRADAGYDLAAANWLVRRHAITYAGSAGVITASRASRQGGGGDFDFLGVGDPVLNGKTIEGDEAGRALLRGVRGGASPSVLAPLPETRLELEQSARGFRTAKLLLQGQATERRFRGELVGAYRYLSFATHGLLRDDIEGLSEPALVLTPVSSAAGADDGLLTAAEIADLNLAARFVALSACNTANFDLTQFSQDLPALASAFAVAGAPATLATLWPVESETSRRIVASVFEALQGAPSLGPAEALAQAQRAFLLAPPGRAYLHPRFWAPFVVLGDGGQAPARETEAISVTSVETLTAATAQAAALHPVVQLGPTVLAGGYRKTPGGAFVAVLETLEGKSGRRLATWEAPVPDGVSAITGGMTRLGPDSAAFVVTELASRATGEPLKVRVFQTGAAGEPRELFAAEIPRDARVLETTLSRLGDEIILTYSARGAASRFSPVQGADDYDRLACVYRPATVVERRDLGSGRLLASKALDGYLVTGAAAQADGSLLLGGSYSNGCGSQSRAIAARLDAGLGFKEIYRDDSLGFSEVRALAATPRGGTLLGLTKASFLNAPTLDGSGRPQGFSAALVLLTSEGRALPARMIDAGADVHLSGSASDGTAGIAVGGSIGGDPVILHLAQAARR